MRLLSSIFSRAGLSYPVGPDEISYQLRWSKTHIPPFGGNHSVWERRNTQNEWNHRLNKFGRNDKKTPPPNQRLLGHGHHGLVPRKGIQGHHSQNKARRQSKPHGLTLHGETGSSLHWIVNDNNNTFGSPINNPSSSNIQQLFPHA